MCVWFKCIFKFVEKRNNNTFVKKEGIRDVNKWVGKSFHKANMWKKETKRFRLHLAAWQLAGQRRLALWPSSWSMGSDGVFSLLASQLLLLVRCLALNLHTHTHTKNALFSLLLRFLRLLCATRCRSKANYLKLRLESTQIFKASIRTLRVLIQHFALPLFQIFFFSYSIKAKLFTINTYTHTYIHVYT